MTTTYDGVEEGGLADIREADNAGFQAHADSGGRGESPVQSEHWQQVKAGNGEVGEA